MANTVKNKIRLGTLFLFLLVLLSCGVGIFNLVRLKNDSTRILKNNCESLDYGHAMQKMLDSPIINTVLLQAFDSILHLQEENITEPGEREATADIRRLFRSYRSGDKNADQAIRSAIHRVLQLNMDAIEVKNEKANSTADKALMYISVLATTVFLVGFTFSYNFPSILTGPINALTEGIQEIARKNYQHRIHLERKDEFGQMANAFNEMAERLEYFENSNLKRIIFEKTRAESVINSLKEASIGIDRNDVVLFANNQALQLLGLKAPDIVGRPAADISKRNDLFRFLLEEQGGTPFKIVVDNRENYFTKETLDISQDGISSKVIVLRNITFFKELDVAKTNFIATISHELKTPLASSDFSLKLLGDGRVGKLSPEQRELIGQLKQDNQRMLKILSELLNMSQVEAGKIQLEVTETTPEAIMDAAVDAVLNTAREKRIIIKKNYEEDLGNVKADADKTTWVLNNFLINAIKYSSEEESIVVNIKKLANEIQFSVADHGPGIEKDYVSKIFDRFFKVPGAKSAGTGLGLAISKEFIEAQGGYVWVKSGIGEGSTFGFNLPVVQRT
jgi:NtrC-family two-component system sensor histidine kinase KinB